MRAIAFTMLGLVLCVVGCSSRPTLTQAQMNALENREVDASFKATFNAASNALFDAGYTVSMSDREGGLLSGTKSNNRRAERRWFGDQTIEDDHYTISIQVRETNESRCSVRVKTAVNGEPVTNKKAIDELWVLMQRQGLMKEPTTAIAGAESN